MWLFFGPEHCTMGNQNDAKKQLEFRPPQEMGRQKGARRVERGGASQLVSR